LLNAVLEPAAKGAEARSTGPCRARSWKYEQSDCGERGEACPCQQDVTFEPEVQGCGEEADEQDSERRSPDKRRCRAASVASLACSFRACGTPDGASRRAPQLSDPTATPNSSARKVDRIQHATPTFLLVLLRASKHIDLEKDLRE
jgi:hypothetical protein